MITDTADKIVRYIGNKQEATAKELGDFLEISPQAVFRQLKKLIEKGTLEKRGKPPVVFYSLKEKERDRRDLIGGEIEKAVNENYLVLTPEGNLLEGEEGFSYWCRKNDLPVKKTAEEYARTLAKYKKFVKNGYINGIKKFRNTFQKVYLNEIYYLDFYSIERFGKTKLGTLLLYAKQSQNRMLIKKMYDLIGNRILNIIKSKKIDAIGFIPPTVSRKIQLQKELERLLNLKVPKIKIVKAIGEVPIPQKTLNKLRDRIENAAKTIFVKDERVFNNILLLDDAVGSGATFNETARKLKERKLVKGKIIGLAITGSFKGFDVISEV